MSPSSFVFCEWKKDGHSLKIFDVRKGYYLHNSYISIITTETNNNVLYPYDILAQLKLI